MVDAQDVAAVGPRYRPVHAIADLAARLRPHTRKRRELDLPVERLMDYPTCSASSRLIESAWLHHVIEDGEV
jgi:hypothetical protein